MITKEATMKIDELMENEDFAMKVINAGSEEKIIQLFAQNGVTVTVEDLHECEESARQNPDFTSLFQNDELDEAALENVSGGGKARKVAGWGIMILGLAVAVSTGGLGAAVAGAFITAGGMIVHGPHY